jgi:hypothetical protein
MFGAGRCGARCNSVAVITSCNDQFFARVQKGDQTGGQRQRSHPDAQTGNVSLLSLKANHEGHEEFARSASDRLSHNRNLAVIASPL